MREKLLGLAFLDPSIAEAILVIDETFNKIPRTGAIEKSDLDMVAGLVGRRLANFGRTLPVEPELEVEPEVEAEEEETEIIVAAIPQPQAAAPIVWDF
jgi:hypothetical protein